MKKVPFNIENRFIGFTTGITSHRRGAVFSGVPPVHVGFTQFTGGFTGGATPVAGPEPVAIGVMTAGESGASSRRDAGVTPNARRDQPDRISNMNTEYCQNRPNSAQKHQGDRR